jgi:hypothetical protein
MVINDTVHGHIGISALSGPFQTFALKLWHTANEGLVRIQYKCLVPIYIFPEMKLWSLLISKTEL